MKDYNMNKTWLILVLVFFGVFCYTPVRTKAYTGNTKCVTIKIKQIDKITVQKINNCLLRGENFNIKIKGRGNRAERILSEVKKQVGLCNGYGILFQTHRRKTSKNYTVYVISKDNAKLYKYTIKYVRERVEHRKEELRAEIKKYKKMQNKRSEACGSLDELQEEYEKELSLLDDFGSASNMYKVRFFYRYYDRIDANGQEDVTYVQGHENGDFQGAWNGGKVYKTGQLMKRLVNGRAQGMCGDIARYNLLLLEQMGIKGMLVRNDTKKHSWSEYRVSGQDGRFFILSGTKSNGYEAQKRESLEFEY